MRVLKGVEVMMRELLLECGEMYGFDGREAIGRLLLKDVSSSKVEKDKRGRPKKAVKEVSCEKVVDLFAGLVSEVVVVPVVEEVPVVVTVPVAVAMDIEEPVVLMEEKMEKEGFGERSSLIAIVKDDCDELADLMGGLKVSENKKVEKVEKVEKVKKDKKVEKKLTEEEKALMEAEKEALKVKKEAEKAEEKLKKEAEKAQEKEALKLKKEAEKAAEKEALKLKKEAEKAAEKEAKKNDKKNDKKKEKKEPKKKEEEQAVAVAQVAEVKVEKEEAPKITVTRFEFEGKQYLKSSENILYDPKSKEELGIWCEESKTIKELPEEEEEDDEEMDEESYEE